jgi:hypothetical protein
MKMHEVNNRKNATIHHDNIRQRKVASESDKLGQRITNINIRLQ